MKTFECQLNKEHKTLLDVKSTLSEQKADEFNNLVINYGNDSLQKWITSNDFRTEELIYLMVDKASLYGYALVFFYIENEKLKFDILDDVFKLRHTNNQVFIAQGVVKDYGFRENVYWIDSATLWNFSPNTVFKWKLDPSDSEEDSKLVFEITEKELNSPKLKQKLNIDLELPCFLHYNSPKMKPDVKMWLHDKIKNIELATDKERDDIELAGTKTDIISSWNTKNENEKLKKLSDRAVDSVRLNEKSYVIDEMGLQFNTSTVPYQVITLQKATETTLELTKQYSHGWKTGTQNATNKHTAEVLLQNRDFYKIVKSIENYVIKSLTYAFKLLDKHYKWGLQEGWEIGIETNIPDVDKILIQSTQEQGNRIENE